MKDSGKTRVVFAEGEDERVLCAIQVIVDEGAQPIVVGWPGYWLSALNRLACGLTLVRILS